MGKKRSPALDAEYVRRRKLLAALMGVMEKMDGLPASSGVRFHKAVDALEAAGWPDGD